MQSSRPQRITRATLFAASLAAAALVAGCSSNSLSLPQIEFQGISQTTQHGYVVPPAALQQVPVGSSKDQVLIALGTPSTQANYGNDVFYYISQTRTRAAAFLPERVVDQRVIAVYFNASERVSKIADYGLQQGKVFDFVSRTTPTAAVDQTFIQQLFSAVSSVKPGV
jgi:outer membrane protein assembly factor BamE (lipoprotein component of BamABCDE complex)